MNALRPMGSRDAGSRIRRSRHAAAACGVLNTGGNVVGFVNPMLVPLVAAAFGWTAALLPGSVLTLLGAATWLFIRVECTIAA